MIQLVAREYEVAGWVASGDEVVAEAERLRPDVVLLDVSLPGKSGLAVLPALRAALADATIIVLTTHVEPIYVRQALERGADAYVLKGKAMTELLPVIREALERRRAAAAGAP